MSLAFWLFNFQLCPLVTCSLRALQAALFPWRVVMVLETVFLFLLLLCWRERKHFQQCRMLEKKKVRRNEIFLEMTSSFLIWVGKVEQGRFLGVSHKSMCEKKRQVKVFQGVNLTSENTGVSQHSFFIWLDIIFSSSSLFQIVKKKKKKR